MLAQRAAQKRKLLSQDADGQPAQEQESDSDADLGAGASRDDEAPLKASAPHRGRLAKAAQQSKLEAASSAAFSADIEVKQRAHTAVAITMTAPRLLTFLASKLQTMSSSPLLQPVVCGWCVLPCHHDGLSSGSDLVQ